MILLIIVAATIGVGIYLFVKNRQKNGKSFGNGGNEPNGKDNPNDQTQPRP